MNNKGLGFSGENGIVLQDEEAHIVESIKRILTTPRGERVGDLSFGSSISKYLFMPDLGIDDLIAEIVNTIKREMPSIIVNECSLSGYENGTVNIDLKITSKSDGKKIDTKIQM